MTRSKAPAPPAGLQAAGRALWRDTTKVYGLRVDELRVLAEACALLDGIGRIRAQLEVAPLTTKGSRNQDVAHPLIAELRSERLAFSRMMRQLGLPDVVAAAGSTVPNANERSSRARAAANARWRA